VSGGGDDPFGRGGEEQTDAFGRPAERGDDAKETHGGFLPPTEGAPPMPPAPPAPPERPGGFLPPTDRPPEREAWWAGAQPGTIEGRAHGATVGGREPAEWLQRAGAALLDFLVRLGIVIAAGLVGALLFLAGEDAGTVGVYVGIGIGALVGLAYAPWMIATRHGQTIGHRVTQTRIVKTDGTPLTGGGAFVREVLVKGFLFDGVLSSFTFAIAPLLNYLWALWDERNECLHDKMCSTRVVKA
jgi:uncharacterized RDD family membrane protein YckC